MSSTLQLVERLIACRSVTPDDGGCQALLADRLAPLGFELETIASGPDDFRVTNLWAIRRGTDAQAPVLAFAAHTDVVPTGPLEHWHSDPFVPTHRDGRLHGRGAADMKSSLAAMVVATEEFVAAWPRHRGSVAFLLTSDEEGPAVDGTVKVCEWLQAHGQQLDACIVGEPSSVEKLGDMIKNGRRGSLSARLVVKGVQGHIAYPQLARNPIHQFAPALAELTTIEWDRGNDYFPPTSWQVSNIHAGTGAGNVIPGAVVVDFNFRFSTENTDASLKKKVLAILDRHGLDYAVDWVLGAKPFLSKNGQLAKTVQQASRKHTGRTAELSTTGGTSDARFIIDICPEVIELGPVNASIHKLNEHIELEALERLPKIYLDTLRALLP